MKFSERLIFLAGIVLILFGFVMVVGGVANALDPERDKSMLTWVIMILLLGILPLVGGFLLCRSMKKRGKNRQYEALERNILNLAKANQGSLTVADVTMNLKISSEEAKAVLEKCFLNKLADMGVSESGSVVYHFKLK